MEKCTLCRGEATTTFRHGDEDFPICTKCKHQREVEDIEKKLAPGMAELFQQLNHMGNNPLVCEAFFNLVSREHRYLQNEFFLLLWKFFERYGSLSENGYDARNEGAVRWAKKWYEGV